MREDNLGVVEKREKNAIRWFRCCGEREKKEFGVVTIRKEAEFGVDI